MKKSGLNRLSKIGLILGAILLLSQPVFSGVVSAKTPKLSRQTCDAVQGKIVGNKLMPSNRRTIQGIPPDVPGKIVGNKLMLIDKTGRQTLAPDGIYTIQGGSKITVNQGQIIDIPSRVINKSGMVRIIEIDH